MIMNKITEEQLEEDIVTRIQQMLVNYANESKFGKTIEQRDTDYPDRNEFTADNFGVRIAKGTPTALIVEPNVNGVTGQESDLTTLARDVLNQIKGASLTQKNTHISIHTHDSDLQLYYNGSYQLAMVLNAMAKTRDEKITTGEARLMQ